MLDRFALALAGLMIAAVANAQDAPRPSDARIVGRSDEPFLRAWRATLDYRQNAGPIEDAATRVGFNRSQEVKLGLEFAMGADGFGRLEIGRGWRDTKRTLTFDDLKGEADDIGFGGMAGVFVVPFAAVGLSLQYRFGDGRDAFTNRAIGDTVVTERDDRSWRTAPFILMTAPVGPVELSAVAAYVDLRSETDYTNGPIASDSGHVEAASASLNAKYWVTSRLELGASIAWTDVFTQRVQASALALDSDWANVGLAIRYRLTDSLDVSASGSRDFANDRGNGVRFGGGLGYRF